MEVDQPTVNICGMYRPFKGVSPESLLLLLDKYISVNIILNTSFTGFVHSIDPVTQSLILLVHKENEFYTALIPGHAILDLTETPTTLTPPSRISSVTLDSDQEIQQRKQKLLAWFKCNLLPVSELGENIVIGNAHVLPPYKTTDIYAENPVVASQIRKNMELMPEDFEHTSV